MNFKGYVVQYILSSCSVCHWHQTIYSQREHCEIFSLNFLKRMFLKNGTSVITFIKNIYFLYERMHCVKCRYLLEKDMSIFINGLCYLLEKLLVYCTTCIIYPLEMNGHSKNVCSILSVLKYICSSLLTTEKCSFSTNAFISKIGRHYVLLSVLHYFDTLTR